MTGPVGVVVLAFSPYSVNFGKPKMGRKGSTKKTPKEIHERMIYGGVDRSLKLSSVDKALKNYNRGEEHLKKWEYGVEARAISGQCWFI